MNLSWRNRLIASIAMLTILLPSLAFASARTNSCAGNFKSEAQVGRFLAGVCSECYDLGDCAMRDIVQVVINVGNTVLELSAVTLFVIFVISGLYMIISGVAGGAWLEKAKTMIRTSTIGLLIVFLAYAGVKTFETLVLEADLQNINAYMVCDGSSATDGQACNLNSTCVSGRCQSLCEQQSQELASTSYILPNPLESSLNNETTATSLPACLDRTALPPGTLLGTCTPNLCPGGNSIQCCELIFR